MDSRRIRNLRNSFDKNIVDKQVDKIFETGRQFVDGVSGARPGKRSPTRHLQLLTNQETKIKLISMQLDPLSTQEGPTELNQLNGPLIRRQVWIKSNNKNLAWAESWWNADQVSENLKAKEEPIWKNLTQDRSELFREVDRIALVNAKWLEDQFCFKGPFWSRNYRFFRDKKPLTIIREVFNPNLETLLGYSGIKEFTKLYSSSS